MFMPAAAVVENRLRVLPARIFPSWCREGAAPGPSPRPDVKNVSLRRYVEIAGAPILDKSYWCFYTPPPPPSPPILLKALVLTCPLLAIDCFLAFSILRPRPPPVRLGSPRAGVFWAGELDGATTCMGFLFSVLSFLTIKYY